jgi:mannose-6-phosphate isomerase-like protein (cupin superfamily)
MPELLPSPTRIPVPGGKVIDEHVGRVNSGTEAVSVARMVAPAQWSEPPQTPEFDEVTLVLRGTVRVEHDDETLEVHAGQSLLARAGETVRYSTGDEEAEYVAVCVPAFSSDLAHRADGQG